jgi:hypothetical protein
MKPNIGSWNKSVYTYAQLILFSTNLPSYFNRKGMVFSIIHAGATWTFPHI